MVRDESLWLSFADAMALAVALIATAILASPDPLTAYALLLFFALFAARRILGLHVRDGWRARATPAEERVRLAFLAALLVLCMWLGDRVIFDGPLGKDQALIFGLVLFVGTALARGATRDLADWLS